MGFALKKQKATEYCLSFRSLKVALSWAFLDPCAIISLFSSHDTRDIPSLEGDS